MKSKYEIFVKEMDIAFKELNRLKLKGVKSLLKHITDHHLFLFIIATYFQETKNFEKSVEKTNEHMKNPTEARKHFLSFSYHQL